MEKIHISELNQAGWYQQLVKDCVRQLRKNNCAYVFRPAHIETIREVLAEKNPEHKIQVTIVAPGLFELRLHRRCEKECEEL